jgi:hypothetical protein
LAVAVYVIEVAAQRGAVEGAVEGCAAGHGAGEGGIEFFGAVGG